MTRDNQDADTISEPGYVRMSDERVALLRHRIVSRYYDAPGVIDMIARMILISRVLYPES